MRINKSRLWAALLVILIVFSSSVYAQPAPATVPLVAPLPDTLILVGDLDPWSKETEELGQLLASRLESNPRIRIVVVGDVCNPRDFVGGTEECYDQLAKTSWGSFLHLIYVVPGNHDYDQVRCTDAVPAIFNQPFQMGERGMGFQVFDWGSWGNFLLNSETMCKKDQLSSEVNGRGVKQVEWFERELKARANRQCVLTIYHRPMYSSGRFASPSWVKDLYNLSVKNGVDLIIWAHEHFFVEYPLLWPVDETTAVVDSRRGIKHLGIGTGGARPFPHPTIDPSIKKSERKLRFEEEILTNVFGAVELNLWPGRYSWQFLPILSQRGEKAVWPSGAGVCR